MLKFLKILGLANNKPEDSKPEDRNEKDSDKPAHGPSGCCGGCGGQ